MTKLELMTNQNLSEEERNLEWVFSKQKLTPGQPMRCSLGSVLQFLQCFWSWQDPVVVLQEIPRKHFIYKIPHTGDKGYLGF